MQNRGPGTYPLERHFRVKTPPVLLGLGSPF